MNALFRGRILPATALIFVMTLSAGLVGAAELGSKTADSVSAASQSAEYKGEVKAEKVLVARTAGNGQKHSYLLTDKPEVTVMTVVIPRGTETGWHMHTVPVYAYVMEGTLDVDIAEFGILTFRKGDAIVEVQNTPHNGRNNGSETVKLVVFYTGEEGRSNVQKVQRSGF